MNKTISINLGGRNFFIEEEAFRKLDVYLSAIRKHFSEFKGSDEIVTDMEARMAEKFSEKYRHDSQAVITISDVEALISELGSVEDITGGEQAKSSREGDSASFAPKRLMRDGDNKIVAGVCSGLAAYFDVDPIVFRFVFGLLIFAWGTIIPIYFLLWLIMPEAKTPTEKMQMRGKPLNLDSIGQTIKDRAEEFKDHVNKFQGSKAEGAGKTARGGKFKNFLHEFFLGLGRAVKFLAKSLSKVIGLALTAGAGVLSVILTFVFVVILFNINSPYVDFPINVIHKGPEFYVLLFAAYLAILIPLQLLLLLGTSIFNKKRSLNSTAGFSLLGIWLIALIAGGALGARFVPAYVEQVQNSPQMQFVTKDFDIKGFSDVELSNSINYKLVEGKEFKVTASGASMSLERIIAAKEGSTLKVFKQDRSKPCFFCFDGEIDVQITAPVFSKISGRNSSTITSELVTASSTSLSLQNSSIAEINFKTKSLDLSLSNSSMATLSGEAQVLKATLKNSSRLEAKELLVKNAKVSTTNSSRANLNVTENLEYESSNSSRVYYIGDPAVEGDSQELVPVIRTP